MRRLPSPARFPARAVRSQSTARSRSVPGNTGANRLSATSERSPASSNARGSVVPGDRRECTPLRQSDRFRQRRAIVAMVPAFLPDDAAYRRFRWTFRSARRPAGARNPPHHASRVREQFVVTDERSRQAVTARSASSACRSQSSKALSSASRRGPRATPGDFCGWRASSNTEGVQPSSASALQPRFREQAHPRILIAHNECSPGSERGSRGSAHARRTPHRPHPVARQRAQSSHRWPSGQQPFVGFDREGVFPVALPLPGCPAPGVLRGLRRLPPAPVPAPRFRCDACRARETRAVAGVRSGRLRSPARASSDETALGDIGNPRCRVLSP